MAAGHARMTHPFHFPGILHSPYFIFMRCAGTYSDADLLHKFGLTNYTRTRKVPGFGPYTLIAHDGTWTMLADDWRYTLWHMESTRPAIATLAKSFETYACSVGDCDRSFDFIYYHEGRLVRKYVVTDPDFRGGRVVENVGHALPGESDAFQHKYESRIVLAIATSLGIQVPCDESQVRIYT
jgi:hypothetical protein